MSKENKIKLASIGPRSMSRALKGFNADSKPTHIVDGNAEVWISPEPGEKGYRIRLRWMTDATDAEPDFWAVNYLHFANVIADGIVAYLMQYCPAPAEMIEALKKLQLPKSIRRALP